MSNFAAPVLLFALALSACATAPPAKVDRVLYRDLRVVVETRERTSWLVDRVEFETALPAILQSTCRTAPEDMLSLSSWLDTQILAEGGPASEAFAKNGGDLGPLDELVTLERVHGLLEYSERTRADCPFWLTPDPDFDGVQSDANRFVLLLESRGGGELFIRGSEIAYGGGGGGRILPAYGFGEHLTIGLGAEAGGGGVVSEQGGEQSLDANIRAAIPLLVRFSDLTHLYDIELAAAMMFTLDRVIAAPGPRIQLSTGLLTYRIGAFMPTAVLSIGYTYHPEAMGASALHVLNIGTRVGVDIDP